MSIFSETDETKGCISQYKVPMSDKNLKKGNKVWKKKSKITTKRRERCLEFTTENMVLMKWCIVLTQEIIEKFSEMD